MAESKSNKDPSSDSSPEKELKTPNVFERAKEEFEAILHNEKKHHHHKETHGLREDINADTPMSDVKAPNVFERAKEEIEALIEVIHPKKDSKSCHGDDHHGDSSSRECALKSGKECLELKMLDSHSDKSVKAKEEKKPVAHKPHHHHKETHGTSDDIDENTPISEVKGPSVFERAKEEIEAIVHAIHPKKDSGDVVSSSSKDI